MLTIAKKIGIYPHTLKGMGNPFQKIIPRIYKKIKKYKIVSKICTKNLKISSNVEGIAHIENQKAEKVNNNKKT